MRQVPHPLIVGDGKMATHFCHYLSLLGINYSQWSRNHKEIPLESLLQYSTLAVLLISDSSIENFIQLHPFLKTKPLVHFSGALVIKECPSAHPLMTFSQNLYDLNFYKQIPFIVEKAQENHLDFLPNAFYEISPELKSYYHMLCVLSGNFTCILWQKFFNELEHTFKLPSYVGTAYLDQISKNIIANPHTALTGPLIRNDQKTLQKHINVLESDEFKDIYLAFVKLFENRRNNVHEHS
jgi:hypothetical protein